MSTERCYYETLEVERNADDSKLKAAFRKLAMKWHPDKNPGDATSEVKFKEINEAYEVLKDGESAPPMTASAMPPSSRAWAAAVQASAPASPRPSRIFSRTCSAWPGSAGAAAARARRRPALQHGNHARGAFLGKTAQIEIPVRSPASLFGHRRQGRHQAEDLPTCGGQGRVRQAQGFFTLERTCPGCQGRGQMIEDACPSCTGSGRVTRDRNCRSISRKASRTAPAFGWPAKARPAFAAARRATLIFLSLATHEFFQRDGADLHCRVPISMVTAALGGEFEVPTIDKGKTRVKVPSGRSPAAVFALHQKACRCCARARRRHVRPGRRRNAAESDQKQQELLAEFELSPARPSRKRWLLHQGQGLLR